MPRTELTRWYKLFPLITILALTFLLFSVTSTVQLVNYVKFVFSEETISVFVVHTAETTGDVAPPSYWFFSIPETLSLTSAADNNTRLGFKGPWAFSCCFTCWKTILIPDTIKYSPHCFAPDAN